MIKYKWFQFFAPLLLLTTSLSAIEPMAVYKDSKAPVEARVSDLLGRMTLAQKIAIAGGWEMETYSFPELGVPPIRMTDGPLGVSRWDITATAFPSGVSMGAAFDPALINEAAAAMGREALAMGKDMLLGPCVNIARNPYSGRNFESYGEDPYLNSRLASAFVSGLQGQGVIGSVKHYALNNQETGRMAVDVRADRRAMREIFFPAFEAAVRAGVWTVMAAYNRVDGLFAAENPFLLNQILKKEWGFPGFVISDWGATHSTEGSANSGLDLEMPWGYYFTAPLEKAVKEGRVSVPTIEDKARRILRVLFSAGVFERKDADRPPKSIVAGPEHLELARRMAREGMVLLKNEGGLLPLAPERSKKLAVIGPNAAVLRAAGGGSSKVYHVPSASPLDVLRKSWPGDRIVYAEGVGLPERDAAIPEDMLAPSSGTGHGLLGEYFANQKLEGKPALVRVDPKVDFDLKKAPVPGKPEDGFSARWTGRFIVPRTGRYEFVVQSGGSRLFIDGVQVLSDWSNPLWECLAWAADLQAGSEHSIRFETFSDKGKVKIRLRAAIPPEDHIAEAVKAASGADAAVIFAGLSDQYESEGGDRMTLSLPPGQDALIEAVAKVNPNTVVVLFTGTPVLMPWADKVGAILLPWYPGQEGGQSVAEVLLGAEPGGRLPVTFPVREQDASSFGAYPGENGMVRYTEGIFVGYRHADAKGIAPLFPFGYGLSYANFAYENMELEISSDSAQAPLVSVAVTVRNTSARAGEETVQIYVGEVSPALPRPLRELKGFSKMRLAAGETRTVRVPLDRSAFAYYDDSGKGWTVDPGRFTIWAGSSSRDLKLSRDILLK